MMEEEEILDEGDPQDELGEFGVEEDEKY